MTFQPRAHVLALGATRGAGMARPPAARAHRQTAERAEPPAAMRNALRFMYAGAGIAVAFGVTMALTTHTRVLHGGNPASGTYKAGYVAGGAIAGLIGAGLGLWVGGG